MIPASVSTLRQLKNVPTVFRLAGFALLGAHKGRLEMATPDGRVVVFDHGEPGARARVDLRDFTAIRRAAAGGDIGFAESYMDGEWSTPDLTAVLEFFSDNFEATGRFAIGGRIAKWSNLIRHFFNRNTREGAKRNIHAHYDLGNEFYARWLDPSMTYSSALFESPNTSLEHGQAAKYAAIADSLQLGPSSSVLEIGCGWGGFAEFAAKTRGSKVTCLTISEAQRDFAVERMARQGLSDRVDIRLEDYRDHRGEYDGVASIEMFEAVGETYWPSYFDKIAEVLKSGGKAALQIITIHEEIFEAYRRRTDFIQRYIFPGGMLPSESTLRQSVHQASLRYDGARLFGLDYARTLKEWHRSFNHAWDDIAAMGFDLPFKRMWEFYLSYCEAGFKTGRINVGQFALSKT